MNTRSLYFRLILWCSGLIIVVLLAFAAYTYEGVKARLYGDMEKTLERRAHQIADNILIHADSKTSYEIAHQIREVYSPAANNRFIRILRSDRSVLYISEPPKDVAFNPETIPLPPPDVNTQRIEVLPSGMEMLMIDLPVTVEDKDFLIEMGAPTREMQTVLHGLMVTLFLGLPIIVLIVSAGAYILVRRTLKPVEDIRATAAQITFGNLRNRLPVAATGDALEHLSITLNQMLERLEDAYQQVNRFSAHASHELRTPLAIMRGELESIIQRESGLSRTLRERIGSALEEVDRLSRIVDGLLTISHLDNGQATAAPITFYLIDLVRMTTNQMLLLAEEKDIEISVEALSSVKVTADSDRLRQVLVNLLDNAIKYTPMGGKITITISTIMQRAVLSIVDTGIGIPEESLPHIFERFYRDNKARSHEQAGTGLGLAIVRAICQAHGGTVEIESIENKGTTCRVILPLAEEES